MTEPDHPVVPDVDSDWPDFLGYNRFEAGDDARLVARVDDDPLLVVGGHGDGRSAAFASDCAPHWGPTEFVDWDGYPALWAGLVRWLAGDG